MALSKAEITKIEKAQQEVLFYGTPEKGYADSGFWKFLQHVYTKDEKDKDDPVKKLIKLPDDVYLVIVFLYLLACDDFLGPKSRQIRMSWAACAFAVWMGMVAKYRRVIYQTKKEDDALDQVTKGSLSPGEGRMDFIIQHLPSWLRDPHIISGKGNNSGALTFSPDAYHNGVSVPWQGSKIIGIPMGAHQVRHFTPSLYLNDESAFQAEWLGSVTAASACADKMLSFSSVDAGSDFNSACLNFPADWEANEKGSPGHREVHPTVQTALDVMGIKWPKGLASWQTLSGAWCLEMSYTADPKRDPARDGAEWKKKAVMRSGYGGSYDSVGWQTEMEINYGAGGGDPVFPKVRMETPIFIDGFAPSKIMDKMRFYAGYDYGARNPSAFIVWGIDEHNHAYAVWEEYGPCTNISRHVADIKRCPYWDRIEVIMCDPSIMSKTQQGAADIKTLAEIFADHGLYLTRGRRGQDVTIAQMFNADYWLDVNKPKAFITKACPNLAREIMDLRWDKHVSEAVNVRKNAPERIRDKNNHAWDAVAVLFDTKLIPYVPAEQAVKGHTVNDLLKDAQVKIDRDSRRNEGIYFA